MFGLPAVQNRPISALVVYASLFMLAQVDRYLAPLVGSSTARATPPAQV